MPKRRKPPKRELTLREIIASWPARKQQMLDTLPRNGYRYEPAGIEAGYGPKYAKTTLKRTLLNDPNFCKALLEKRQEIEAGALDRREKALQKLDSALAREGLRPMEIARLVEVQGRILGWVSDRLVLEVPERKIELDASHTRLAQRLAGLMHQTAALPGEAPMEPFLNDRRGAPRLLGPAAEIIDVEAEDDAEKAKPVAKQDDADHNDRQDNDL